MTARIAVAHGDGIGPEIMDEVLRVLHAAGAELDITSVVLGLKAYQDGNPTGVDDRTWEVLHEVDALLKAPMTTPQGGGFKSLNVTLRTRLGLAVNVRPARAYAPFVDTLHPTMDVVVVRENEEDLYTGMEYRTSQDVTQAIKLISRPGSERVIRYAFDYARAHGRTKVTALVKDNILKITDGLFAEVFEEISAEYPEIIAERYIVDIGFARIADRPEDFDVIVCPNLYGDIVSDITAQLTGSVGLGPSANIGIRTAMFEAIHGSAPDIAGRGIANPSGLLLAAVEMLTYLGQSSVAETIHHAWSATIQDGVHTGDISGSHTQQTVGTRAFADAVIARLGCRPSTLPAVTLAGVPEVPVRAVADRPRQTMTCHGVDVFLAHQGPVARIAEQLSAVDSTLALSSVACRGVQVWPDGDLDTELVDHVRARFSAGVADVSLEQITQLLTRLAQVGLPVVGTQNLLRFDGQRAWSLAQGE